MRRSIYTLTWLVAFMLLKVSFIMAQENPDKSYYQQVKTYVNPVLPGDHPDPTLLKVGDDFYHCGSSFHFTPYMPVYHSKGSGPLGSNWQGAPAFKGRLGFRSAISRYMAGGNHIFLWIILDIFFIKRTMVL